MTSCCNGDSRPAVTMETPHTSSHGAATCPDDSPTAGGRNTWPRKRHVRSVAHVGDIFTDVTSTEARPAGKMAAVMYTVEFDDFNGSDLVDNGSDLVDNPVASCRMARGKRNSLPKGE